MIILVLILILTGSVAGTAVMALQGATWWQIALGYVGGGWAGLIAGLPAVAVARGLGRLPLRPPLARKRPCPKNPFPDPDDLRPRALKSGSPIKYR